MKNGPINLTEELKRTFIILINFLVFLVVCIGFMFILLLFIHLFVPFR